MRGFGSFLGAGKTLTSSSKDLICARLSSRSAEGDRLRDVSVVRKGSPQSAHLRTAAADTPVTMHAVAAAQVSGGSI